MWSILWFTGTNSPPCFQVIKTPDTVNPLRVCSRRSRCVWRSGKDQARFHQTHLAGRWRRPGSLLWPECPVCRCWASFPKRNGCREGVKLTSTPPPWPVHSACRRAALWGSPAARCPPSSSQPTSWTEKQQEIFDFTQLSQVRRDQTHKTTVLILKFHLNAGGSLRSL